MCPIHSGTNMAFSMGGLKDPVPAKKVALSHSERAVLHSVAYSRNNKMMSKGRPVKQVELTMEDMVGLDAKEKATRHMKPRSTSRSDTPGFRGKVNGTPLGMNRDPCSQRHNNNSRLSQNNSRLSQNRSQLRMRQDVIPEPPEIKTKSQDYKVNYRPFINKTKFSSKENMLHDSRVATIKPKQDTSIKASGQASQTSVSEAVISDTQETDTNLQEKESELSHGRTTKITFKKDKSVRYIDKDTTEDVDMEEGEDEVFESSKGGEKGSKKGSQSDELPEAEGSSSISRKEPHGMSESSLDQSRTDERVLDQSVTPGATNSSGPSVPANVTINLYLNHDANQSIDIAHSPSGLSPAVLAHSPAGLSPAMLAHSPGLSPAVLSPAVRSPAAPSPGRTSQITVSQRAPPYGADREEGSHVNVQVHECQGVKCNCKRRHTIDAVDSQHLSQAPTLNFPAVCIHDHTKYGQNATHNLAPPAPTQSNNHHAAPPAKNMIDEMQAHIVEDFQRERDLLHERRRSSLELPPIPVSYPPVHNSNSKVEQWLRELPENPSRTEEEGSIRLYNNGVRMDGKYPKGIAQSAGLKQRPEILRRISESPYREEYPSHMEIPARVGTDIHGSYNKQHRLKRWRHHSLSPLHPPPLNEKPKPMRKFHSMNFQTSSWKREPPSWKSATIDNPFRPSKLRTLYDENGDLVNSTTSAQFQAAGYSGNKLDVGNSQTFSRHSWQPSPEPPSIQIHPGSAGQEKKGTKEESMLHTTPYMNGGEVKKEGAPQIAASPLTSPHLPKPPSKGSLMPGSVLTGESSYGDSGIHSTNDDNFWEIEEELYFVYLQTESGAIVGPLQMEINNIGVGLPTLVEKNEVDESASNVGQKPPEEGLQNRATGSNSMNEHSSRSHSLLTLQIDSETQDPDDENLYITKHGKLTFVDLAGSEKVKNEATSTAGHLQESNNINKSLLVLGNCISALGDPKRRQGHIPYRDSKLTKLLADSLGGNGVTLMIACVSPSSQNGAESLNTLRYANRAKKIKTKPVVKMDPREKLILSLKREVKILRQENHYLRQQLEFPVKPRGQLQKENDRKFLDMLQEQQKKGTIGDHGLYEMLQEYMIENETLRTENSDLHHMRDQCRREQQVLARENEKLNRKMEYMERERAFSQTPVSLYSVSSSRNGSAAQAGMYEQGPHGTPPQWNVGGPGGPPVDFYASHDSSAGSWGSHGMNRNPMEMSRTSVENPQYAVASNPAMRSTPPARFQHPMKPPHRLSEPVLNQNGVPVESPRVSQTYGSRHQQQQSYYQEHPSAATAGLGATYPPPGHPAATQAAAQQRTHPPGPNLHPMFYNQQQQQQQPQGVPSPQDSRTHMQGQPVSPSNRPQQGHSPHAQTTSPSSRLQQQGGYQQRHLPQNTAPVVKQRRSRGGGSTDSLSIPSDNGSATLSTGSASGGYSQDVNERLRQELFDLEGQIHNQAQQNTTATDAQKR